MTSIYHNPRCRKSRETLQLLQENGEDPKIILYLENPPKRDELKEILDKLGMKPLALIRKGEAIWKEHYKGKELSDKQLIDTMVSNPKLIERPIVLKGEKAALGRPPEQVLTIL